MTGVGRHGDIATDPLGRISDERAIERLISGYGHALDHGTPDDYAELFTDDGVFEIRSGLAQIPGADPSFPEAMVALLIGKGGERTPDGLVFRGRKALKSFVTRGARTARSLHVSSQPIVTLLGADDAEAVSYLRIYRHSPGSDAALTHFGRYLDRFRRTTDGWRIRHRISEL